MTATAASKGQQTIDQFLTQVKAAADGSKPLSEPGSIGGETAHPTGKVDDRLQKVTEGERSSENSKDVKNAVGAPSVESAKEAGAKNLFDLIGAFAKKSDVCQPGSAHDDHLNIGLKAAPTGEDKSVETGSAKAGKEDKKEGGQGGTTHPANTENSSIDGHKWAADTSLEKMASDFQQFGNAFLADLHQAYTTPATSRQPATKQAAVDADLAFLAGHELAGLTNGTFDKQAAARMVDETIHNIVKEASDDADMWLEYATGRLKAAEGPPPPMPGDPAAGGGPAAPPAPPMPGAGPAPGPGGGADMLSALGGAGGPEGPPPGGPEGGGGEIDPAQLQMILEQLHTTPEELMAALEAEAGGGGGPEGGAGPDMGGGPEGGTEAPPAPGGPEAKVASDRGGKKPGVKRAEAIGVIQELLQRSRTRR